jgi:N-acetylglucosaminyldiphosphoundecaprenol N-acetyl-beta-D-mannosaminyltransferase
MTVAGIRQTQVTGMRVDAIASTTQVVQAVANTLQQGTSLLMTFANPGTAVMVRRLRAASLFNQFDIVGPDGIAMVKAIHWLHRVPAIRTSFDSTSLAPLVFRLAVERGSRIVLVGGKPGVTEQASRHLQAAYPGLNIVGQLHGYVPQPALIAAIRRLEPAIVICGMGGLLQESLLVGLTATGWRGVGFTCGGYFDQLSNGVQYYPKVVDSLNLRWAWRLAMEPRRLWRRYLLDYPVFVMSLGKNMILRNTQAPIHPEDT